VNEAFDSTRAATALDEDDASKMKPIDLLYRKHYGIEKAMRENFLYEDHINRDYLHKQTSSRNSLMHSQRSMQSIYEAAKKKTSQVQARLTGVQLHGAPKLTRAQADDDVINIARD
jgi:hypothetical protein